MLGHHHGRQPAQQPCLPEQLRGASLHVLREVVRVPWRTGSAGSRHGGDGWRIRRDPSAPPERCVARPESCEAPLCGQMARGQGTGVPVTPSMAPGSTREAPPEDWMAPRTPALAHDTAYRMPQTACMAHRNGTIAPGYEYVALSARRDVPPRRCAGGLRLAPAPLIASEAPPEPSNVPSKRSPRGPLTPGAPTSASGAPGNATERPY